MTRLAEISAVVLVGGSSRRMGHDKAFIEIGEREVLDRMLEDALPEVGDILIVGREVSAHSAALSRYGWEEGGGKDTFERQGRTARLLHDRRPGMGPLAGLEIGLAAARHPAAWVLACDLPFMPAAVGRRLVGELDRLVSGEVEADVGTPEDGPAAVVPMLGERPPPLCVLCEARAADVATRCLDAGTLKMLDFLGELRRRSLPASQFRDLGDPDRIFLNLNRPEDVERAEGLA